MRINIRPNLQLQKFRCIHFRWTSLLVFSLAVPIFPNAFGQNSRQLPDSQIPIEKKTVRDSLNSEQRNAEKRLAIKEKLDRLFSPENQNYLTKLTKKRSLYLGTRPLADEFLSLINVEKTKSNPAKDEKINAQKSDFSFLNNPAIVKQMEEFVEWRSLIRAIITQNNLESYRQKLMAAGEAAFDIEPEDAAEIYVSQKSTTRDAEDLFFLSEFNPTDESLALLSVSSLKNDGVSALLRPNVQVKLRLTKLQKLKIDQIASTDADGKARENVRQRNQHLEKQLEQVEVEKYAQRAALMAQNGGFAPTDPEDILRIRNPDDRTKERNLRTELSTNSRRAKTNLQRAEARVFDVLKPEQQKAFNALLGR